MGSKDKEFSSPEGSMNPYEKQQMKNIEENEARMKAKGFHTSLIGKSLQEKYNMISKRTDVEMSDDDLVDSQPEVPRDRPCKKTLTQQGSMADFVKLKSKERQQKATQSKTNDGQPKEGNLITTVELPVSRELVISQHEVSREKAGKKIQHKSTQSKTPGGQSLEGNSTQQKENQSKQQAQQVQRQKYYCAPESMSRYNATIRQQKTKQVRTNDGQTNDANLTTMRQQRLTNTSDILEQPNDDQNLSNDEMDFEQPDDENSHQIVADAPDAAVANENEATEKKKHRGKTHLGEIHMRTLEERDVIILNNLRQVVGPTKDVVQKFNRFLGTVARNPTLAPLNVLSWHYMSTKDKIWEYVQSKYIVPEEAKEGVLSSLGTMWRNHKTKLKKEHFSEDATWEELWAKRPKDVPECQFKELLEFWGTKEAQDMSKRNKDNREKQTDMHTMGPTSIAVMREEMQQNDPERRCPTQAELYIESRKRKVGRTYLTPSDETLNNIEKMKELQSLDGSGSSDPYYEVMSKKEHSGRLRMYGHGVTQSSLKKKDPKKQYIVPSMLLDSITAQIDQKVEEKFASFLSKIREANPGVDLVIPSNAFDEGNASNSFQD